MHSIMLIVPDYPCRLRMYSCKDDKGVERPEEGVTGWGGISHEKHDIHDIIFPCRAPP